MKEDFLPWYPRNLIEFLSKIVRSDMKVFEYGSGNSTLYYARLGCKVTAIESSYEWYKFVIRNLKFANCKIILCENLEKYPYYIRMLDLSYDIIVIDGKFRIRSLMASVSFLNNMGLIIFDNSNYKKYDKIFSHLRLNGFCECSFSEVRENGKIHEAKIFTKNQYILPNVINSDEIFDGGGDRI